MTSTKHILEYISILTVDNKINRNIVALTNMGMRLAGLAGRFALALYLARYLGLKAVGFFGLTQGLVAAVPPIIGFGLNYFVTREIVGSTKIRSGLLLRDRLAVTITMLAALGFATAIFLASSPASAGLTFYLMCFIVGAECIAFDIHMSLISMGMPIVANFLFFLRSALWVFPITFIGIYVPATRSINVVFEAWAAGDLISLLCLVWFFRKFPYQEILNCPVNLNWLTQTLKRGWLIYANDIGIVGQVYLDRYVVDHFLGVISVGKYTLSFTLANSVTALVATGVMQLSVPHLIAAANVSHAKWIQTMKLELARVIGSCIILATLVFTIAILILPAIGMPQYSTTPLLLLVLLVGSLVKSISDMMNYGLYSMGQDKGLAICNISGLLISLSLSIFLVRRFGLIGTGISMTATAFFLGVARIYILRHHELKNLSSALNQA